MKEAQDVMVGQARAGCVDEDQSSEARTCKDDALQITACLISLRGRPVRACMELHVPSMEMHSWGGDAAFVMSVEFKPTCAAHGHKCRKDGWVKATPTAAGRKTSWPARSSVCRQVRPGVGQLG